MIVLASPLLFGGGKTKSMQSTKNKIKDAVSEYIRLFPNEYAAFLASHRMKANNLQNDFAELKGSDQMVRHLVDVPETLFFIIKRNLNEQEYAWLYSLDDYKGKRAGMAWFLRAFPQFKITKDF